MIWERYEGVLVAECSEIWERGCFNESAGGVWLCVRAAQTSQRQTLGNEKGNGHIPETGDTHKPMSVVP